MTMKGQRPFRETGSSIRWSCAEMKDPFLANRSSASVWLCGCRVASGTARGRLGSGWEAQGVGREEELEKEGSLERWGGV